MDDACVGALELFGQENGRIAGAAAGDQHPEMIAERLPAGKAVVVDHRQVVEPGLHQAPAFVGRIAGRIGLRLVLRFDFGQEVVAGAQGHGQSGQD
ncbi:MAG: hypothetical protein CAPSK01_001043 [Candidatus Accumulibacter vicinus]|uniref:Uncharacterized protein n=1 Tax=Candidatus Accumulibacter vicinus TaxID=2954382 RepID=A0A084Y3K3_9PROT|nr:MAG: hypothetical protein CAPSK01_001043 [Candidatus Accumulibacter vicinus]